MTVFERKTRLGDEETGVEVCRKSRQMLDFFGDSPIPATSVAKLTPRTMETESSMWYHERYSVREYHL